MNPAATVDAALRQARERGVERLDAHLLLAHVLGQSRAWLLAHGDDRLSDAQAAAFGTLIERRADGEPFAYLVGQREFHGLSLAVTDAVLVPRPDTETLVEWALELLAGPLDEAGHPAVLDLGTGSGAIALAIKHACARAQVWAGERSADALAGETGVPAFDLVVSNPPYIAADDPHLAALVHEPLSALVAGDEGLADIRRIAEGAAGRLRAGGWLLFEHGWQQAPAVQAILQRNGFREVTTRVDLEGRARCTGGRILSL